MLKILLFIYIFFVLAFWKVLYSLCADSAIKAELLDKKVSKADLLFATFIIALIPIFNVIFCIDGICHYDSIVEASSKKTLDKQNKK